VNLRISIVEFKAFLKLTLKLFLFFYDFKISFL